MKLALRPLRVLGAWLVVLLLGFASPSRAADAPPATSPVASAVATATPERLSFAVIIGNNKSLGRRRPELHYADDDAARYFEILRTMAPGRAFLLSEFDRDTERLFPDAQLQAAAPTRRGLENIGQRLAQRVRAAKAAGHETELYFIFAGHGDVDQGEGFIELADARFRSKDLKAWLQAIPFTRAHVILDSCNSFFMLGVRKPGGRHFATSEDAVRALASRLPNVGVFLSTSAEGEAFEWSEIQSGIFSHVVRSGLLGAADANADGQVSYLELAAFVDTATADVKNPNMRPHVFARGPGASDHAAIARLYSMSSVRRFELSDGRALRLRMRDQSGLPLLDAHNQRGAPLKLAVPEAWARGATLERSPGPQRATEPYALPDTTGTVTLAALSNAELQSAGRGPDETFQTLFAQPFGPSSVTHYALERSKRPPPVYGVSEEDVQRMDLLLAQLATFERGRRIAEGSGAAAAGLFLTGAGIGVLHVDPGLSKGDKTEQRVLGGVLTGVGGLFVLGGVGSMFATTPGERAALDFRATVRAGADPTQAFAAADERIREISRARRAERMAAGFFGSLTLLGSATGLIWSELAADPGDPRMARRLAWGGGMLAGALMLGDAIFMDTPIDSLTRIWRDDPGLNQYRAPSAGLNLKLRLAPSSHGCFFGLAGEL